MEDLKSLPPEYLILICEFTYASRGKSRNLPSHVRRFLVGMTQHSGGKKRYKSLPESLPERIAKKFGSSLLSPLYFSLIRQPFMIGSRLVNSAVGAIAVYYTPVVNEEEFTKLCTAIKEEWQKTFGEVKEIEGFRMVAGYRVRLEG
jgi:hypothetical protein